MKVSEAMTSEVRMVNPEDSIHDAARLMADMDVGALPVSDSDRLVGAVQWLSERRICALASPCQMRLAWPVSIGIGSSFITQRAMSCSTP